MHFTDVLTGIVAINLPSVIFYDYMLLSFDATAKISFVNITIAVSWLLDTCILACLTILSYIVHWCDYWQFILLQSFPPLFSHSLQIGLLVVLLFIILLLLFILFIVFIVFILFKFVLLLI